MQLKRKKIPCYVLIFDQLEIIWSSLEFLTKYADRLDLIVIENPSTNTPQIKKMVNELGEAGLIKRYYLFEENITANAFDIVLSKEIKKVAESPLVLVTDGDIISEDADWLDEEIAILQNNPDLFACGISLSKSNLPLSTFPAAKDWIPADRHEYSDFFEVNTGVHLLLTEGRGLAKFIEWKERNGLNFVDSSMHRYCYEELRKKWARTKHSEAYHLTWDLYLDKNHPYTKLKTSTSHADTWYHARKANYVVKKY